MLRSIFLAINLKIQANILVAHTMNKNAPCGVEMDLDFCPDHNYCKSLAEGFGDDWTTSGTLYIMSKESKGS